MINNYISHKHKSYKLISFTLIEVIMTILILSIISVYTIPRLANIDNFKISIFLRQVYSSLMYAQEIAMGSGCHVSVNINSNNLELKLRNNCQNGDFSRNIQDPFYKKDYYIQNVPNNVYLTTNNFPIYFDHNGQIRLISTNNIAIASLTITANNLQEIIYINGENGLISKQ